MKPDLRPYPDYKPSGIPWLGEVPEHWILERLKSSMNNIVVQTTERQSTDLYIAMEHVESWSGRLTNAGLNTPFDSQVKRFRSGDVLFGKLRPYLAKVTRPRSEGVCVGEFLVLRPRHSQVTAPYMEQLLRSKPIIDTVNSSTFGARMPRADWKFMGGMAIVRPPLPEQTAITRYLDYTDRRIQRYIRAKQKLIALLEEQRQAIIHQAVTGQIDVRTGQPYPAYKDSGVEWLGEVPEHWGVRRLRNIGEAIIGLTYDPQDVVGEEDGILVLRASNIFEGRIVYADNVFVQCAVPDRLITQVGDILLCSRSGSRALIGKNARIDSASSGFTFGAFMTIFRSVDNDYLHHVFNSKLFEYQSGAFLTSTINQLTLGILYNIKIPWPPLAEQREMIQYLDTATTSIANAIERTRHHVDLLNEYRTRLISDVVTGKLDVREVAAKLPEVDPLETEADSCETLEPTTELAEEFEAIAEGASA